MKVSRELASKRIDEYVTTVLLSKLKDKKADNAARFKIGWAHAMGMLRITDEQFADAKELGLVDAEGNIDMDLVRKGVDGGVATAGGELFVKKLGIWLSSDDLSGLMEYVETGVQKQG